MLKSIFPLPDLEGKELWHDSRLILLGNDQEILTSLALQSAVTAASAKDYVAVLGCRAVKTVFRVHGMPQFQDGMVDFIRPRYLKTAESLADYFARFHTMQILPDAIVLIAFEDYVAQVSGTSDGDGSIVRLLAFLEDVVDFASKKRCRPCRLVVTYAGTDGRPGTLLQRWGTPRAPRWCCGPSDERRRFVLKGHGTARIDFRREGGQLRFTGLS